MKINKDLERSYIQYINNKKLGYIKLSLKHKLFLIFTFPVLFLLPLFFLSGLLFSRKETSSIFVLRYTEKAPYNILYKELESNLQNINFINYKSFFIPIVPMVLIKDYLHIVFFRPIFFIKNIDFFIFLLFKIFKYYFFIKKYGVKRLIVFQEYSFYMSYLTRIMEYENKSLFNIMHGIPGRTYNSFRFSKCFIWGEYFKKRYIKYNADKDQFIISGSIYHNYLLKKQKNLIEDIDIVYIMAGKMDHYEDIIKILEELSDKYTVRIKQHPRHYLKLDSFLKEDKREISEIISGSKILLGHYTTGLFDATILGKQVISYLKGYEHFTEYLDYLDKSNIIYNKDELKGLILTKLKDVSPSCNKPVNYILNTEINSFEIIKKEIAKGKDTFEY